MQGTEPTVTVFDCGAPLNESETVWGSSVESPKRAPDPTVGAGISGARFRMHVDLKCAPRLPSVVRGPSQSREVPCRPQVAVVDRLTAPTTHDMLNS